VLEEEYAYAKKTATARGLLAKKARDGSRLHDHYLPALLSTVTVNNLTRNAGSRSLSGMAQRACMLGVSMTLKYYLALSSQRKMLRRR